MRRIAALLLSAGLLLTLAGPAAARQAGPTIVGEAIAINASTGEFDHLIAAVVRAGLVGLITSFRMARLPYVEPTSSIEGLTLG